MTEYDVLNSIPEVSAIEQSQLQAYCDEWVKRPVAQQRGIAFVRVESHSMLRVVLDSYRALTIPHDVPTPVDELVGFIIDQHFTDSDQRRRLYTQLRDVRSQWEEADEEGEYGIGRVGTVYLPCKACHAWMETGRTATKGETINIPPTEVTCPGCGVSGIYNSWDYRVHIESW